MENKKFVQGDVVVLKSGSPKLTVLYQYENEVTVQYYNFETNVLSQQINIPTGALKLHEE